jgi:glutamate synthase domain-containing protein 1
VQELNRYRSDFFGRLREILSDRENIRIVGDRFVFQSEVLFPTGSAQINAAGQVEMKKLADYVEDVEGTEILSMGNALELIKDLGDAKLVSSQYKLAGFKGTHGIGHTRMATESDVDIRSAHPYWAYPYNDIAVVHNGQITNYWIMRREMERRGHRFMSNCDSELIAVYLADRMDRAETLEDAMRRSVDELDGVFTYLVATAEALGMAKDTMAAKPMAACCATR